MTNFTFLAGAAFSVVDGVILGVVAVVLGLIIYFRFIKNKAGDCHDCPEYKKNMGDRADSKKSAGCSCSSPTSACGHCPSAQPKEQDVSDKK